jgi:hypothetical protein
MGFLVLSDDAVEFQLVASYATSTHGIRVSLTAAPRAADQYEPGDALNPATWSVTRLDTNASVTVIGAVLHDATTVDLITLDALGNHFVEHEVAAIGLIAASGDPLTGPNTATLDGVVHTMDPLDAVTSEQFRDRDLANPPFQVDRGLGTNGTIIIGADGDYATEAGEPLIKKLVTRRLGTPRGAFKHLPRYGIGLQEKEPVASAGDLMRLRKEIETQVLEEPDVANTRASLTMDRSGVLIVQVQIKPKSGTTVNIRMGSAGGRLVEL